MTTYNSEKDVKRHVKKLLDQHQWFWWMPPANGFGRTGISDFNALRAGVFLAVETKFGTNTPTQMQRGFLSSVASQDGFAFVVDEKNIDWFERWLGAFDRSVEQAQQAAQPAAQDGADMLDAMRELIKGY